MNKTICPESKCTGCYACVNICPRHCIEMRPKGVLGHVFPYINNSLCINCNLCKQVCQVNNPVQLIQPINAYAGKHQEEKVYLSCTSGGASYAISQNFLQRGGIVYGCVESKGVHIYHKRIENIKDLQFLKGSKYTQSDIGSVFIQVKDDLKLDKKVLFIGTPCQVAGLKSFLRKECNNLYTMDLICHGTPSQEFLRSYVRKKTNGQGHFVSFRRGNEYLLQIFDDDDNVLYRYNLWEHRYKDLYFNAFIDGYISRESCVHCRYASSDRCSDITIGDFWGLDDNLREIFKNGCSCILPITRKGDELILSSRMVLYNRSIKEAVKGNERLRSPKANQRRPYFDLIIPFIGVRMAYIICELDHVFKYLIRYPIERYIRTQIHKFRN